MSENGEIHLLEGFPMRYEEDERVISFSLMAGRVVIMNPTMGLIVEILGRYKNIIYENLLSKFVAMLKAKGVESAELAQRDLSYAIKFLFSYVFINIKIEGKTLFVVKIVKKYLMR